MPFFQFYVNSTKRSMDMPDATGHKSCAQNQPDQFYAQRPTAQMHVIIYSYFMKNKKKTNAPLDLCVFV